MDEHRSPAERVLDLIVFGPAGLALTAVEEFPKLVDKGRNHLEGQARTARIVGQVAVQMGRRQLGQMASSRVSKPSSSGPAATSPAPDASNRPPASPPSASSPPASSPSASGPPSSPSPSEVPDPVAANGHGSSPALAIPGYDSLSASQVVQRLAGLSRGELVDVRTHEQSHRHRRTILNRVEQLLAGVDAE